MNNALRDAREAAARLVRVLVGDQRPLIAEAMAALVATLPAFTVTGVIYGDDPTRLVVGEKPDISLVGVATRCSGSLDFVRMVREAAPGARIVIVADKMESDLVKFVLEEQINGLLLNDGPAADFAASLNQVVQGHAVLPAGWQGVLSGGSEGALGSLSDRQMQVLRLLSEGCSYEEIGSRLFISLNTVKFHVRSIFLQLGVRNRVAAARMLAEASDRAPIAFSIATQSADSQLT
jgi:DNA-binding NarL/FixJ family response regulator